MSEGSGKYPVISGHCPLLCVQQTTIEIIISVFKNKIRKKIKENISQDKSLYYRIKYLHKIVLFTIEIEKKTL